MRNKAVPYVIRYRQPEGEGEWRGMARTLEEALRRTGIKVESLIFYYRNSKDCVEAVRG